MAFATGRDFVQFNVIEIVSSETLGFLHKKGIDIRAIPVRICDRIVRARRDKQLIRPVASHFARRVRGVIVKRETALQPARNLRVMLLPAAPLGQGEQARQIVAKGNLFQEQIRERRGRLADDDPRVGAALQKQHRETKTPRDHSHQ
jgi:hypothetical protein